MPDREVDQEMKTKGLSPELVDAVQWLQGEVERHQYGAFGIEVAVHHGRVAKVSRTATEILKPQTGTPGNERREQTNEDPRLFSDRRRS